MLAIIDILDDNHIAYKSHGEHKNIRNNWIAVECPFCGGGDEKFHLGISLEDNRSTCWSCGWHPLVNTLMELTHEKYSVCFNWVEKLLPVIGE